MVYKQNAKVDDKWDYEKGVGNCLKPGIKFVEFSVPCVIRNFERPESRGD